MRMFTVVGSGSKNLFSPFGGNWHDGEQIYDSRCDQHYDSVRAVRNVGDGMWDGDASLGMVTL
jgi:hypothetical protein